MEVWHSNVFSSVYMLSSCHLQPAAACPCSPAAAVPAHYFSHCAAAHRCVCHSSCRYSRHVPQRDWLDQQVYALPIAGGMPWATTSWPGSHPTSQPALNPPRPTAFVSTLSSSGVGNLAPFSYFNVMAHNPPHVCIGFAASRLRPHGRKDTLFNLLETGWAGGLPGWQLLGAAGGGGAGHADEQM